MSLVLVQQDYQASAGDRVIVDASQRSVTVKLPSSPRADDIVEVHVAALGSGCQVFVAPSGLDSFEAPGPGAATNYVLSSARESAVFRRSSTPGVWVTFGDDLPLAQMDNRYFTTLNVKSYGAKGDGVTDDSTAIQKAINDQQASGGTVYLPPGTYLCNTQLVAAAGVSGAWTNSVRPLQIRGAGMDSTVIKAGSTFGFSGLITSGTGGVNPNVAQLTLLDVTLDGNYSGAGGTIAQPASNAGALVNLPWPGTSATSTSENGRYHLFERVRFYRPTGYTFQPTNGAKLIGCEFSVTGQPAAATNHYDTLGSGQGDAIVLGCTWRDSTGNYADFVATTGIIRLIFQGNESYNHTSGGIYACGAGSIITGNRLRNSVSGGGIGYDAGTAAGLRANNIVANNVLTNINVNSSGLDNYSYGDQVYNNIAADSAAPFTTFGAITARDGMIFGTPLHGITGTIIHGDGTNLYAETNGAGTIFLRPGGNGSNNGRIDIAGGGIGFNDSAGAVASKLWSGTGAPAAGLGSNGDFYFRFDTPGTVNQRLYVKNAGTWTAIL